MGVWAIIDINDFTEYELPSMSWNLTLQGPNRWHSKKNKEDRDKKSSLADDAFVLVQNARSFHYFISFYLRVTEKPSTGSLSKCLWQLGGTRSKVRARNPIWGSHSGGRHPISHPITCHLPGFTLTGSKNLECSGTWTYLLQKWHMVAS